MYDEARILEASAHASRLAAEAGCKLLYTLKPFAYADALRLMVPNVAGFAAASVFEARMARDVLQGRGSVHITAPALREHDAMAIQSLCDYVSFNSITQWERLRGCVGDSVSMGLRINPKLSFVTDVRYDPCRNFSKLGVPLENLQQVLATNPGRLEGIEGLHFHTNCDSSDLGQLQAVISRIHNALGPNVLSSLRWLNMGGGYLFGDNGHGELCRAVESLRPYDLEVFVEPGATIVRAAGSLVTSVVDLFENDGHVIAVLDTTVNHMPEVFEYQFEPDVLGDADDGAHHYVLAGSSCLAGDIFGSYAFHEPLEIGSRIVIENMGAYTMVKAHMFNGINLPRVYALSPEGRLMLKKAYSYADFASRFGAVA